MCERLRSNKYFNQPLRSINHCDKLDVFYKHSRATFDRALYLNHEKKIVCIECQKYFSTKLAWTEESGGGYVLQNVTLGTESPVKLISDLLEHCILQNHSRDHSHLAIDEL